MSLLARVLPRHLTAKACRAGKVYRRKLAPSVLFFLDGVLLRAMSGQLFALLLCFAMAAGSFPTAHGRGAAEQRAAKQTTATEVATATDTRTDVAQVRGEVSRRASEGGKRVCHFLFVLSDGKSTLHLISTCMCTHVRNANHPPFALDLSLLPFNHLPLTFDGATNPRLRVDMGWADASWHREAGYKEVSTPKMEALAKVGPSPTALSVRSVRQHAASLPKLLSFMLHAALIYADVRTIHRDVVGGDRA